jgi:hypothetical protein
VLLGHYAPAFALRPWSGRVPLWGLFLAVQAVDIGYFILVAAGLEGGLIDPHGVPRFQVAYGGYSHSLLMTAVYAAAVAIAGVALGYRREGAVLGLAVASHWLGDLIVHVPDLPVTLAQAPVVGLGLWRLPVLSSLLEVGLLGGAYLLLRPRLAPGGMRARLDRMVIVMMALQALSDFVIPIPPTMGQMGLSMYALYLALTVSAFLAERRRVKLA